MLWLVDMFAQFGGRGEWDLPEQFPIPAQETRRRSRRGPFGLLRLAAPLEAVPGKLSSAPCGVPPSHWPLQLIVLVVHNQAGAIARWADFERGKVWGESLALLMGANTRGQCHLVLSPRIVISKSSSFRHRRQGKVFRPALFHRILHT